MAKTLTAHDHIVLLLDTAEFENLPSWLTENFNIIEGGTHTGGSSRNKLIVIEDGTYLELFNWIKQPVEFLAWSRKLPGLIDFALTTMPPISAEQNFNSISTNLSQIPSTSNLGVVFEEPQSGGRKRKDGIEVKWKTTRPVSERTDATPDEKYFPGGRLDAPFFCHDVTERDVRVQFNDEHITTHPCGAVGIDNVQVLVPDSYVEKYVALYAGILDCPVSVETKSPEDHFMRTFEISVPNPVDQRPAFVHISSQQHYKLSDAVTASYNPEERSESAETHLRERGIGIQSITLRVTGQSNEGTDTALGTDAIGKTVRIRKPL